MGKNGSWLQQINFESLITDIDFLDLRYILYIIPKKITIISVDLRISPSAAIRKTALDFHFLQRTFRTYDCKISHTISEGYILNTHQVSWRFVQVCKRDLYQMSYRIYVVT